MSPIKGEREREEGRKEVDLPINTQPPFCLILILIGKRNSVAMDMDFFQMLIQSTLNLSVNMRLKDIVYTTQKETHTHFTSSHPFNDPFAQSLDISYP